MYLRENEGLKQMLLSHPAWPLITKLLEQLVANKIHEDYISEILFDKKIVRTIASKQNAWKLYYSY